MSDLNTHQDATVEPMAQALDSQELCDSKVHHSYADAGSSNLNQADGDGSVSANADPGQTAPATDDAWPEPVPLPVALPPVMSFHDELLPVSLRAWVMDIAHRMQCPPDFPAVAALVAASSLIGARAVVQPKAMDDWRVVPNLWGMTVGRPGVKKSPALGEALRPLSQLEDTEHARWLAEHDAWELECRVLEMQEEANLKAARKAAGANPAAIRAMLTSATKIPEPMARRYVVNDATVEKLGELMRSNPWGILSYRDELHGLLTSMDKQGQEEARAFYLQGYDGNQGYTFDRIGRGTIHLPRVCLAMLGGIQPGRIHEYVRGAVAGGRGDDGLVQRFGLTVWPDTDADYIHVDQKPDAQARQVAWEVFERLSKLTPANGDEPDVWRFDDEAQRVFVDWLIPFERELRGEALHPAIIAHLSKYRKLIPALALVFAMVDAPSGNGVIKAAELRRAIAMGTYLRTHAERLYAAATKPETAGARTLLNKLKAGKLTDANSAMATSFTPRVVAGKHWAGLDTPDAVRNAANLLADYGWLELETVPTPPTGGRPSERYLISPWTWGKHDGGAA